jgi:predicted permease
MMTFWEQLAQDLRYAVRTMASCPFFTAMAVLSLTLGIGANTAIYSFMDSILMRALPVHDPESLVVVNLRSKDFPAVAHSYSGESYKDPKYGEVSWNLPYPSYELMRDKNSVFSSMFGFSGGGRLNVQIKGQADSAAGQYVTGRFFSGLGVPPAAGRLIDDSDDRTGAPLVVVLGYTYAQRRFGDVTAAVGQPVLISTLSYTIIGVAAPEFFGVNPGGPQDMFLPLHGNIPMQAAIFGGKPETMYTEANYYWLQIMARLKPGASRQQAQAELEPLFHNWVASTAANAKERANLPSILLQEGAGGLDSLRRQYSKPLYVLMTLVGFILAIACANIGNLLLARAAGRRREMAVRLSLGAGRARIVRQLLTESVMLAVIGGALGVAFAAWGIRALTLLIANGRDNFTLFAELNWNVLLVTVAISVLTGVLFGLTPALQSTRVDLTSALKEARLGEQRVRLHSWARISASQVLVVTQIAISLLLLVSGGVFVHNLKRLNSIQLGFNRESLLLVTVNARQAGYQDESLMRFYDRLRTRFQAMPGVRGVTLSNYALVSQSRNATRAVVPGYTGEDRSTGVLNVGPDFFATMQTPILLGRDISERDVFSPGKVAVINELFARKFFNGDNPLGRRIGIGRDAQPDIEIIGVAKTARFHSLKQEIPPVVYITYTHNPRQSLGQFVYEIRAAGDPMSLASSARRAVVEADPKVPVSSLISQSRVIDQTIGQERTFATLCTCFAVLAVLIACVGLYGSMCYSVARRTNEIGIRMALGARRTRLIWMVMREVVGMTAVGLAIGVPVAFAAFKFVESFLFQMKPNDPVALWLAGGILMLAALAAGYGPAWRASRIDPWVALRDE